MTYPKGIDLAVVQETLLIPLWASPTSAPPAPLTDVFERLCGRDG